MKYTKRFLPNNLKIGMVLSEDLNINGVKLLPENSQITEPILQKLITNYPNCYVTIHADEKNAFVEYKASVFESLNEEIENMSITVEKLFSSLKMGNKLNVTILMHLTSRMVKVAKRNVSDVIKLLNRLTPVENYLYNHSLNVGLLSVIIGLWTNQSDSDLNNLACAGLLHDIGKLHIPKDVLHKKDSLSKQEFDLCKTHVLKSYRNIKKYKFLNKSVKQAVLFHHERLDGSGYPMHLKDDKIPLLARITAVADTFDAITSNHEYKTKKNPLFALESIYEDSFSKFDAKIATTFIHNISKYYEGTMIKLNDSSEAYIVKLNQNNFFKPIICVDNNNVIDLSKQDELEIVDFI